MHTKVLLCVVACLAAASLGAAAAPAPPAPALVDGAGSFRTCLAGREHNVTYAVTGTEASPVYDIDTFSALKAVECNVDQSSLKIIWHDEIHSTAFWAKVKTFGAFLTSTACPLPIADQKHGLVLRRVISSQLDGQALIVSTAAAGYDQIYESADIQYEPTGSDCTLGDDVAAGVDQRVCVGVNTDDSCAQASGPIPIYSNDVLSLSCSDCFAGLRADVFFTLKIRGFTLQKLEAGFRAVDLLAKVELDMEAQKSWSAGVDKQLPIFPHQTVIDFKIGPVPFLVWFESSVHLVADAQLQTTASASAGLLANYSIGDYYVHWDPDHHWSHVKPDANVSFTPSVSGSASFDGTAAFTLAPAITLHANQLFTYTVGLTPNLNLEIKGDASSQQICETTTYDVSLTSEAELHLNIDWLHVHDDKTWGPNTLWGKQGSVSQHCVKA